MPNLTRLEAALRNARDFESFAQGLLRDALAWPVERDAHKPFDLGYEWSPDEIGTDRTRHTARAFELMLLPRKQQHGIFLLEFHDRRVFDTRGFATPLRAVLRRLVAGQRKDPHLASWKFDNILFICTHDYTRYSFAMFRDTFKTGKVSEARLATFGWDKEEPCRTVIEHNLPHLKWPSEPEDKEAWAKQWAEAFNKEPLTRKFFKQFDSVLELIKADLEKLGKLPSAEAYSRAQLLLERLIFLYFVQNRGWLDQQANFLRDGFEPHKKRPNSHSYYEEFLEPLFWSLSSPGHSQFRRNETVPFLNGGLFNDDEFEPSPRRRKDNPALPIRNATFAKVFDDLLEAFNFTVREDTPLNQEVAVDPEMLGKVFESIVLHAEAADETASAPDKRKETGSFYTPRIVVHFICRETLYQWLLPRLKGNNWPARLRRLVGLDGSDGLDQEELKTLKSCLSPEEASVLLELVKALRCCDPAVGSGAFMIGLLHELTNLRRLLQTVANGYIDPLRKDGAKWLHETKADIIQNNLFGVDIQQQAIEICMLRLWLSLVVDYDIGLDPFAADRKAFLAALKEVSQLPNLEMNFKRGDSLHDHICGVPVRIIPGKEHRHQRQFDAIHRLGAKLHKAKSWDYKRKLRLDILKHRLEVSELVIADELKLLRQEDSVLTGMFGETGSDADRRRRIAHETGQLEEAQEGIRVAQKTRDWLEDRPHEHNYQQRLRELEGASFDAPFNFAWRIDFPQVFYPEQPKTTLNGKLALGNELKGQMDLPAEAPRTGGFDIFVGNPPFVTARRKEQRERWRARWQPYCYKEWHLLVPFFPLAKELLHPGGQLGYIVSNAFGTRAFGKPFVERFFPLVNLQKVVDCSGFSFEGHGTPTCLVFLGAGPPYEPDPVRVVALKPGGGALKLVPEDSPVWHVIACHHDEDYEDRQLIVDLHPRGELRSFPWSFLRDAEAKPSMASAHLGGLCDEPVGAQLITGKDEAFVLPSGYARRCRLPRSVLKPYGTGEDVRNWSVQPSALIIFPYDKDLRPLKEPLPAMVDGHLRRYKRVLENSVVSRSTKKKETSLRWFEYRRLARAKWQVPVNILGPHIATHAHYILADHKAAFKEKAIAIALKHSIARERQFALLAVLNGAYPLFWLKQVCYNKGAGSEEEKDRFEFAGGKVEQLPVPESVAEALCGEWNPLAKRLADLAQACWERGQVLPRLALKKLFEKPGEAYHDWNSSLPGYEKPHEVIAEPFTDADSLKLAYDRAVAERERLRSEMIALQEEMDWLVYAAYGLLPEDHPAIGFGHSEERSDEESPPAPLDRNDRPYRLWQAAEGNFARAIGLIPTDRSDARQSLWRERLAAIRDNEHIRRIEQPVYKRRWDEQWKVKGRWECGPVAYEAELRDAFEWWLLEKAEWWLEHQQAGGPIELADWAEALWQDRRVRAAVEVLAAPSASPDGFQRLFRSLVDAESVADGIPFAKPWDELAKNKFPGLAQARKIRGKLNVPRERFHKLDRTVYKWAGLLFR